MLVKTAVFTEIVGETYTIVRNVYGRPGREPREPGLSKGESGGIRLFGWEDAVAWRITRMLCELGLTWDEAATVVRREDVAHYAVSGGASADHLFAVWSIAGQKHLAAWRGTVAEIAEVVQSDFSTYGITRTLRAVSLHDAVIEASNLACFAGYPPDGEGFTRTEAASKAVDGDDSEPAANGGEAAK